MQKLAKRLSVFMAAIMTLSLMLNFVMAAPAKAATIYPQVQYAQEPQLEYTVGDRVQFNLFTPNYGGRVQYRVVLWNDETKSYKDLWTTTPDRYYDKWMPYGNNIFTLGWVINEPGHYRITIYAKRAGVPNNDTYLKGFNCDSYMESDSFVVKAKEVAVTPDVAAESLKLDVKSTQMIVGQDYTVKADVKKAGVKVIFLVDAPADSLNKDVIGEALSDSNGIATYKYTRTYADADYVTAFSSAAPAIRDAQKVYWGVKPILTITALDKDDAASVVNGGVKQYKVKLVNPLTGEPMKYKEVKIMLKENIDTLSADIRSTATVTNDFNGVRVTPYQRLNDIVPGGLNEVTLALSTNDNGEATFTLTGYNTKATPIAYYDAAQFFNEMPALQLFKWSGQLPAAIGVPDTSQYAPVFAGDNDNRLDPTELKAQASKTVSFDLIGYTFESSMDGTNYVAIDRDRESGRTFTVTVKKPDGTPLVNRTVMVRLEELFDNTIANDCKARIYTADGLVKSLALTTSSSGKIKFTVVSNSLNDIATPRVWVDQDTRDSYLNYLRDELYTQGEPTKLLDVLYFVDEAVESGALGAEVLDQDLSIITDDNDDVINLSGNETAYGFTIYDQNGVEYVPQYGKTYLTWTLKNTGDWDILVYNPATENDNHSMTQVKLNGDDMPATYTLKPDETITIYGINTVDATSEIHAKTINTEKPGKLSVKVHAVTTRSHELDELFIGQWRLNPVSIPWFQPSNTTDSLVSDGEVVSSWIGYRPYEVYPMANVAVRGKVVAFDKTDNFAVINLDNKEGTYVKVAYERQEDINELYFLSFPVAGSPFEITDLQTFEYQLSLEDSLNFIHNDNTAQHNFEYKLYNADNSNDIPAPPVVPTISDLHVSHDSVVGVTSADAKTPNTVANGIKIDGKLIVFNAEPVINANAGNNITVTVRQNDSDNLNITATANTLIITLANATASKNAAGTIETAIRNLGTVSGTDYAKFGVWMAESTYTASTGNSIANPTAQLTGGKIAVTAVVGEYNFTLNKVIAMGDELTIGEYTYTAGIDFIAVSTTTVEQQAASIVLAVKAKDVRFNCTGTKNIDNEIYLVENVPTGDEEPELELE